MFHVGDKVFYPMHGAGIVEAIEEMEIQGKKQTYYVIHIPCSEMNVMVPIEKAAKLHIRSVVDHQTLKEILADFWNAKPKSLLPWKQRHSSNMEKMRSGDMHAAAEVVRDLINRSKDKPLNTTERQMLNEARKLLISELTIIKDIDEKQAAELLKI